MDLILLTKSTIPVIGWVADLLGIIMDWIFRFTSNFGVMNIGLCIIIFTIIINLILLPLTYKQQKSTKLMSVMQPEIQAIQKKYKGKKDNDSMMRMQTETKAVYEKYGTSMTGGCIQLAIQMPILFALYQVIYKIPAYVSSIRVYYDTVATNIMKQPEFINKISDLATSQKLPIDKFDYNLLNHMVDLLYKFTPDNWASLSSMFPDISSIIDTNAKIIISMNLFLGINLSTAPWQGFNPSVAWLIPILAGLSQWYSTKLMSSNQATDASNPMAQQMKSMNMMMPLMSVFFCFTFPAGIGIYWVAAACCRIVQQLVINSILNKESIDELVSKNIERANKKREKKGLAPQTINKNALIKAKNIDVEKEKEEKQLEEKIIKTQKQVKDSSSYYNSNAKPGSLASKANMVSMFDEKQKAKKSRKNVNVETENVSNINEADESSEEK